MVSFLKNLLAPRQRLVEQERELRDLKREVHTLRLQNESMRSGMRRCVTCDYRIDFKRRQDASDT